MKNSTTALCVVGALVLTAVTVVMYLFATTDLDRQSGQVAVATVRTEAVAETAKEVPETNKIVGLETASVSQNAMSETDAALAEFHLSSRTVVPVSVCLKLKNPVVRK